MNEEENITNDCNLFQEDYAAMISKIYFFVGQEFSVEILRLITRNLKVLGNNCERQFYFSGNFSQAMEPSTLV